MKQARIPRRLKVTHLFDPLQEGLGLCQQTFPMAGKLIGPGLASVINPPQPCSRVAVWKSGIASALRPNRTDRGSQRVGSTTLAGRPGAADPAIHPGVS